MANFTCNNCFTTFQYFDTATEIQCPSCGKKYFRKVNTTPPQL